MALGSKTLTINGNWLLKCMGKFCVNPTDAVNVDTGYAYSWEVGGKPGIKSKTFLWDINSAIEGMRICVNPANGIAGVGPVMVGGGSTDPVASAGRLAVGWRWLDGLVEASKVEVFDDVVVVSIDSDNILFFIMSPLTLCVSLYLTVDLYVYSDPLSPDSTKIYLMLWSDDVFLFTR